MDIDAGGIDVDPSFSLSRPLARSLSSSVKRCPKQNGHSWGF